MLLEVADAHSSSPATVALRWLIQRGVAVVTDSASASHYAEALRAVDAIHLSEEEMRRLSALQLRPRANQAYQANRARRHASGTDHVDVHEGAGGRAAAAVHVATQSSVGSPPTDVSVDRPASQALEASAARCEPFCAEPCSSLSPDGYPDECGACTSAKMRCRPGQHGWLTTPQEKPADEAFLASLSVSGWTFSDDLASPSPADQRASAPGGHDHVYSARRVQMLRKRLLHDGHATLPALFTAAEMSELRLRATAFWNRSWPVLPLSPAVAGGSRVPGKCKPLRHTRTHAPHVPAHDHVTRRQPCAWHVQAPPPHAHARATRAGSWSCHTDRPDAPPAPAACNRNVRRQVQRARAGSVVCQPAAPRAARASPHRLDRHWPRRGAHLMAVQAAPSTSAAPERGGPVGR